MGLPTCDAQLRVRALLYGYCVGIRVSRDLRRACVDLAAFPRLAGQQMPNFHSIGRFWNRHLAALANSFLQALELCQAAGMVSLSQVALDGTKVRANAPRRKAMSYRRLTEKQTILAAVVSDLLAEADATDAAKDARFGKEERGDELPSKLARRESRLGALTAAWEQLNADANERARKDAKQKARERGDDETEVTTAGDDATKNEVVAPKAQPNFIDPGARILKTADGSFHQG